MNVRYPAQCRLPAYSFMYQRAMGFPPHADLWKDTGPGLTELTLSAEDKETIHCNQNIRTKQKYVLEAVHWLSLGRGGHWRVALMQWMPSHQNFTRVVSILLSCTNKISWRRVSALKRHKGVQKHLRLASELPGLVIIQVTSLFPTRHPPCSAGQRDLYLIMPESQPNATEIKCCLHRSGAEALHSLLAGQDLGRQRVEIASL